MGKYRHAVDSYDNEPAVRVVPAQWSAHWSRRSDGTVRVHLARCDATGQARETTGADAATIGHAWQWLAWSGIITHAAAGDRGAFLTWLSMARVDLPDSAIRRG